MILYSLKIHKLIDRLWNSCSFPPVAGRRRPCAFLHLCTHTVKSDFTSYSCVIGTPLGIKTPISLLSHSPVLNKHPSNPLQLLHLNPLDAIEHIHTQPYSPIARAYCVYPSAPWIERRLPHRSGRKSVKRSRHRRHPPSSPPWHRPSKMESSLK